MMLAICATGPSLDAEVDARFARCPYFLFVDSVSLDFEAVENSAAWTSSGAGPPAAFLVARKGAEAVLTGHLGPSAAEILAEAGIPVYAGAGLSLRTALEELGRGRLPRAEASQVACGFGQR